MNEIVRVVFERTRSEDTHRVILISCFHDLCAIVSDLACIRLRVALEDVAVTDASIITFWKLERVHPVRVSNQECILFLVSSFFQSSIVFNRFAKISFVSEEAFPE